MAAVGQISRALADEAKGFFERSQAEFSMQAGPASADATAKMISTRSAERQAQIAATVKAYQVGERRILEDPRGRESGPRRDADRGHDDRRQPPEGASQVAAGSSDLQGRQRRLPGARDQGQDVRDDGAGSRQAHDRLHSRREAHQLGQDLRARAVRCQHGRRCQQERVRCLRQGDRLRAARAKAAGRVFNELEDWRLFQHWTPDRVSQFPADEYVKDHMAEISNGGLKLFDKETGVYATAGKYDEILRWACSDIKTEGGSTTPFSKDMRTFQFQPGKTGSDAWLNLQAKYGVGNEIISTLAQHVEHMSRTIALHEQFGGQPDAMFAGLLRLVKDDPSAAVKGLGWTTSAATLKNTYNTISGRGHPVANETFARFMSGARDAVGLASLRNLPITIAPGDSAMTLMASKFLGMDGFKVLGEVVNGGLTKDEARHLQVQANSYMDYINNSVRQYENRINISGLVRKVSRGFVKATGADWWTANGRRGWQTSMLNFLAPQGGKAFDKLPEATREHFMSYYGFTPANWDTIRQAPPMVANNGAKYIDPNALPAPLSERLMAAIKEQGSYAFHQPDARTQAIMRQGAAAGTIPGEMWLSRGQYEQFTTERMTTHMMRVLVDGPMENRVVRGAAFTLLSMAAGALSLQTAAVLAGKDPMDMANPKFWAQAFAKGGAGGLFGDMVQSAVFGGRDTTSILGQMAGPVPGMAGDAIETAAAPIRQTIDATGKKSAEQTMADNAFRAAKRWTPSTWYSKVATDRLLWDKLQVLVDPNYRQSFVRLQKNAAKQGSGYWWSPGQSAPQRPPDFLSAIGTSR